MRCVSPLMIRKDGRRDIVPCGKCNFCLETKRNDWSFRIHQELRFCDSAYFLTLTYEDDKLPKNQGGISELRKRDMQLFMKKLRKKHGPLLPNPIRYYTVGEYGTETQRPHYHSLLFNAAPDVIFNRVHDIWSNGHVHVGEVEAASIHYVTKYVINRVGDYSGREPPFALMSRRPGIGSRYLESHRQWHRAGMRNYTQLYGRVGRLPRFYKERIFTDLERARLAIESVELADQKYLEAVEKLSRFHSDPYAYFDERISHSHEKVFSKLNQSNIL